MAVRADSFTHTERAIWVVLSLALCFVELRTIYQDRDEHDRQQAEARERETKSFEAIANGITGAINQSKDNFAATMNQFHVNVNEVTGGDSFAFISPILLPVGNAPNSFPLILAVRGKYDLMDAIVEVRRLPIPDEGSMSDTANYINGINVAREVIGTISHTTGRILTLQISDLKQSEINEWSINVFARNRPTHEDLKVRWNSNANQWESRVEVTEEVPEKGRNHTHKILERSKPEWHGNRLLPPAK